MRYEDIKILELKEVSLDFDVRKECIEKEYIYKIEADLGELIFEPLQQYKLVYSIAAKLDLEKIRNAMNILVGTHNFYNFTVRNSKMKHEYFRYIRKINDIYLHEELSEDKNIQKIVIGFKGPGFLTYQIRYMVNALKEIGEGNYSIENLAEALNNLEKDPDIGRKPAPAKALFLKNVVFRENERNK